MPLLGEIEYQVASISQPYNVESELRVLPPDSEWSQSFDNNELDILIIFNCAGWLSLCSKNPSRSTEVHGRPDYDSNATISL